MGSIRNLFPVFIVCCVMQLFTWDNLAEAQTCHIEQGIDVQAPSCAGTAEGGLCLGQFFTNVTFATPYSAPPHVIVTARNTSSQSGCVGGATDKLSCFPSNISTTGFRLNCSGSPVSGSCSEKSSWRSRATADWIAVETGATASCGAESAHSVETNVCGGTLDSQGLCTSTFYRNVTFSQPFDDIPQVLVSAENVASNPSCAAGATDQVVCYPSEISKSGFRLNCSGSPAGTGCTHRGYKTRATAGWIAKESTPSCVVQSRHSEETNDCLGSTVGGTCTTSWVKQITFDTPFSAPPRVLVNTEATSAAPSCAGGASDKYVCYADNVTSTGFRAVCYGSPVSNGCGANTSSNRTRARFGFMAIAANCGLAACSDGLDNDSDGQIDFPADAGCSDLDDNTETADPAPAPECNDGLDNDSDGFTDFPNDPGCDNLLDDDETGGSTPQCSDGLDNDSDGLIDFPDDPGCTGLNDNTEPNPLPQCSDGFDNDLDLKIDLEDIGCSSSQDDDESDPLPQCSDGIDNDEDGFADFPSDPQCTSSTDWSEENGLLAPHVEASDGTSPDHVRVIWTTVPTATSYQVYRRRYSDGAGEPIGEPSSAIVFLDTSAVPGIVYEYSVRAFNATESSPLSNWDPGYRFLDGDPICDEDDVSDNQEIIDETDPCDPDSRQLHLKSPAYAYYNTFLGQNNFLEVTANGTATANVTVTVYAINGSIAGQANAEIAAGSQVDFDIRQMAGLADTYGLVRITWNDTTPGATLIGRIVRYRPNTDGLNYSFAVSEELRNPTRGNTIATANTYDPQGVGFQVANWASIVNLSPDPESFKIELYNQAGQRVRIHTATLAGFESRDFSAGHEETVNGALVEGAYFVRFIPADGATNYFSAIRRYSTNTPRGVAPNSFFYSFALEGRHGTGDILFSPISNRPGGTGECWSQTNWLEVVNARPDTAVQATVVFRGPNGQQLATPTILTLQPLEQYHLNASALLSPGNIGSASLQGNRLGAVIAQSVVYYHNCRLNQVDSAYASQARIPGLEFQAGSFNTNLNMQNELILVNSTVSSVATDVSLRPFDSLSPIVLPTTIVPDSGTSIINLHNHVAANRYGSVLIDSTGNRKLAPFVLRFRKNYLGEADFAVQTLPQ